MAARRVRAAHPPAYLRCIIRAVRAGCRHPRSAAFRGASAKAADITSVIVAAGPAPAHASSTRRSAIFYGYKPDWLYESLPYVYVAAGTVCALLTANPIGIVSGLLLISAGAIVWHLRRSYRKAGGRRPGHYDVEPPPPARPSTGLAELSWRNALDGPHPELDAEHRSLFALGNAAIEALVKGRPEGDVEMKLQDLLQAFEKHCADEAVFLEDFGRPLTEERRAAPGALLARARELDDRYREGRLPVSALVGFVAYDVVVQHVAEGHYWQRPEARH